MLDRLWCRSDPAPCRLRASVWHLRANLWRKPTNPTGGRKRQRNRSRKNRHRRERNMRHDGITNGRDVDFVWLGHRILAVIGSMDLEGSEALAVISYTPAVLFGFGVKKEAEMRRARPHLT